MRVLLIEDDDIIAPAIVAHFAKSGVKIDHISDCKELDIADVDKPFDVIILDVGLPGKSGLSLLNELRRHGSDVPILIFTAQYEIDARVHALNLGADDYLTKPFDMRELFARCQALSRRRGSTKSMFLEYRDLKIDTGSQQAIFKGASLSLTPKVFRLLCHLVENKGRVLSRSHLEEHLYGWDSETESNTLEVFVSQIRRSIGADYVRTVRGMGYIVPLELQ